MATDGSQPPLLIVGASTRAAAWSALRAGFAPICIDQFADDDLRAVADVRPSRRFPQDVVATARHVAANVPWMYTGGLENYPRLISALSERELLGNPAGAVRGVRDPYWAERVGIRSPLLLEARTAGNPPPDDGGWMLKPVGSAAGRGIAVWNGAAAEHPTLRKRHWFQRRAAGTPISAVCLAAERRAVVIGFSRQWIGEAVCHAGPFQYCGSIGPIDVPAAVRLEVERFVAALVERVPLRGLFGCDLLLDGDSAWLTEINPRYTASIEVFEFAAGVSMAAWHRDGCRESRLPALGELRRLRTSPCVGKGILYAPYSCAALSLPWKPFDAARGELPELADIPRPGSLLPQGVPAFTVFAAGSTPELCEAALRERVSIWSRSVFPSPPAG